ncbi:MAG: NAD(P)/FAD-dependent oxidoreductase [Clostridia bacterium]|nr:NAD(P)/FAD-dependent oxidoreductase [Clostridia bacterium]
MDGGYSQRRVGVIGGGPAGMMASIYAVQNGAEVTLFERNPYLGKKLGITGKGRCNVTNDCDNAEFLKNVIANPKFLYASINNFSTQDTKSFFEGLGVPLKTERGRRVFPVSDKASDIVNALKNCVLDYGVRVVNQRVTSIITEGTQVTGLRTEREEYRFDAIICATGGASYPMTGSDGDGYKFARELGIEISPIFPSLVPLETKEDVSCNMGLSLKNVTLKIVDNKKGKTVFSELGEMLFTHFGLTGPLVLSASSHMREMERGRYTAYIDFKPALDYGELDKRVISDFSKNINKDFCNSLGNLLPSKIIPYIIERSGIRPDAKVNEITKVQRKAFVDTLKGLSLEITGFRPLREAIVTAGGISVKEINPSDMQSKKYKGLYFAGEIIDVDAYTGGYNLQIAFSTGALAGMHASWGE